MHQFIIALIRTVVPALVGSLFGWLASVGLDLDAETQGGLIVGLVAFFTGLYYAAVTWAAARWKWFGWLLGVAQTPVYGGITLQEQADDREARHALKAIVDATPAVRQTISPALGMSAEDIAKAATRSHRVDGNVIIHGTTKLLP